MFGSDFYRIHVDLRSPVPSQPPPVSADYRHSEITVLGFDIPAMLCESFANLQPLKAQLLGDGVIHLFRDFYIGNPDQRPPDVSRPGDDTMVSILAVPTYYTAADLLGFIGDFYVEGLTHLRILKSERPNRYLILLKFRDAVKAADFQYHYDGKPFNAMEPETCHVVFVKTVVLEADEPAEAAAVREQHIPFFLGDPFTSFDGDTDVDSTTTDSAVPGSLSESGPQICAGADSVELPTCPVCLERLDHEISGLLTIPCQHTFHCLCLSRWQDDTCPVCRYTNDASNHIIRRSVRRLLQLNVRMQLLQIKEEDEAGNAHLGTSAGATESCMGCLVLENLWVCLICGNVGCSRYAPEQHSIKHFVETGHCFAMELATSRVWDYVGDKYVHRLITNGADGKIVELADKASSSSKSGLKEEHSEYAELLLSQLISQREYYELLLSQSGQVGKRLRRGSSFNEGQSSSKHVAELESRVAELTASLDKLNNNVVSAFKKKISMMAVSAKLAAEELMESNALNDGLSAKVEHLMAENARMRAQCDDLADQVKDLMFYLEAQEKFKDQPEDVKEGTIVMMRTPVVRRKKK